MDIREYAHNGRWWTLINGFTATSEDSHYDSSENVVIKAGEAISVRFAVCHVCQGRGNYVNPAIDSHGLTRDDFDADPDFYEDYRAGVYNIRCEGCEGRATIPVPTNETHILALRATAEGIDEVDAIYEAERRMGA
jgi:hypothetical protein